MNSFFPNCAKTWNKIDDELRNSDSISKFKKNLLSSIRPSKKVTYGIHNPNGIKNIFRLRLGLSKLKAHKKRHNFLDTPSEICDCGEAPEDSFHFLLRCNRFANCRQHLLNDVQLILRKYDLADFLDNPDLYLYGNHMINTNDNKSILRSTIKFITASERFL